MAEISPLRRRMIEEHDSPQSLAGDATNDPQSLAGDEVQPVRFKAVRHHRTSRCTLPMCG